MSPYLLCVHYCKGQVSIQMIKAMHVCIEGVKRSLNSFNCYSCYSCQKGQKITLCAQYRYIQCYVQRVKRLCYLHNMDMSIQMIKAMYVCVEGVERSLNSFNCYHLHMWVGNAFSHVCLSLSVFLSVQAITFELLDIETLFLVFRYILIISRSSLSIKVKVIRKKIVLLISAS